MKSINLMVLCCALWGTAFSQIIDTVFINPDYEQEYAGGSVVEIVDQTKIYFRTGAGSQLSGWIADGMLDLNQYSVVRNFPPLKFILTEKLRLSDTTLLLYGSDRSNNSRIQNLNSNLPEVEFITDINLYYEYVVGLDTVDTEGRLYTIYTDSSSNWSYLWTRSLDSLYHAEDTINSVRIDNDWGASGQDVSGFFFESSQEHDYGIVYRAKQPSWDSLKLDLMFVDGNGSATDTMVIDINSLGIPNTQGIIDNVKNITPILFKDRALFGLYGQFKYHIIELDLISKSSSFFSIPYGPSSQQSTKGSSTVMDVVFLEKGLENNLIYHSTWRPQTVDKQDPTSVNLKIFNPDNTVKWETIIPETAGWHHSFNGEYEHITINNILQMPDSSYVCFIISKYDLYKGLIDAPADFRFIHFNKHGENTLGSEVFPLIQEIKLYPNPVISELVVNTNIEFKVFNIHGQLMPLFKTEKGLEASTYPPGMYLLITKDGKTIKFVKN